MKVHSYRFEGNKWDKDLPPPLFSSNVDSGPFRPALVLCFGSIELLEAAGGPACLQRHFPHAHIAGCSTAGEIFEDRLLDHNLICIAIEFQHGLVAVETLSLKGERVGNQQSAAVVRALGSRSNESMPLQHVFVLCDTQHVTGEGLAEGFGNALSELSGPVSITGGLAGDYGNFARSDVWCEVPPPTAQICAIGFYGKSISVASDIEGGWMPLGAARQVTRAKGNTLYELDNQPALDLYRDYLGDYFSGLPKSGLLFPIAVQVGSRQPVIRAMLAVDHKEASMTYAGDIPEGSMARIMTASLGGLIDAASQAAETVLDMSDINDNNDSLALVVSCYARLAALGERTEEELEELRSKLPNRCKLAGFYSYGEIGHDTDSGCDGTGTGVHNQSLALTLITETL